jgi:hypothetical protein
MEPTIEKREKVFTKEEIAKLAPNYRGKAENFDPAKVGQKSKPPPRSKLGPKQPTPTPPSHINAPQKPTAQRNESMISKAIFGVDVIVTEIDASQEFNANYSKVPAIANEIYAAIRPDEMMIDKIVVKEKISYYATAMLWMKLIEVKTKELNINQRRKSNSQSHTG